MLIDWFTVVAQAINFLILVWLLKRFLYQPILDAIDARERRIAKVLADADMQKAEALQERDTFQRKNQEFDQQRNLLLQQMTDEVAVTRRKLLDDARQAADAFSAKRREALQREQQNLGDEIESPRRTEVFSITRKTLTDLADISLEECIANVFNRRVRELHGDAKQELAAALSTSSDPVSVRSAFRLTVAQQTTIRKTLKECFAADIEIEFETSPDVIGGIELTASGRRVAWSIDEYLKSLEKSIGELTHGPSQPRISPETESELVL